MHKLPDQYLIRRRCFHLMWRAIPPLGKQIQQIHSLKNSPPSGSNMATKWGICSAGKISHDFVVALKTLPAEDHQVDSFATRSRRVTKLVGPTVQVPRCKTLYELKDGGWTYNCIAKPTCVLFSFMQILTFCCSAGFNKVLSWHTDMFLLIMDTHTNSLKWNQIWHDIILALAVQQAQRLIKGCLYCNAPTICAL